MGKYDDLDEVYQELVEPVREWWEGFRFIDPLVNKTRPNNGGDWQKRNPEKHATRQRLYRKQFAKPRVLSNSPRAILARAIRLRKKGSKV